MKEQIKFEINRLFGNKLLYVSMISVFLILYYGVIINGYSIFSESDMYNPCAVECWIRAAGYYNVYFTLIAPVFVTIPFVATYWWDMNTGFINYIGVRKSLKKYIIAKWLVNGIAGGIVLIVPLLLLFILLVMRMDIFMHVIASLELNFCGEFLLTNPILYVLCGCLLAFFFGFVYATMGLAITAVTNNRFIGVVLPIILYFAGDYFGRPYISPSKTLSPYAGPIYIRTYWDVLNQLIPLLIIASIIYFYVAIKRSKL